MRADGRTDEGTQETADKAAGKTTGKRSTAKESRLSWIASYLAVATFFFGVGNVADLWDRFFGDKSPRARAKHVERQARHFVAVQGYFGKVDELACRANATTPAPPKELSAAWLNRALSNRLAFTAKWAEPELQSGLTEADQAAVKSAISKFVVGTDFWAALLADVKARDVSAYNEHVGEYRQVMADYRAILAPYRTAGCAVVWPNLPVWRP